jgi:peptidoglycan/LPS O-acetylase OafA/YrhL
LHQRIHPIDAVCQCAIAWISEGKFKIILPSSANAIGASLFYQSLIWTIALLVTGQSTVRSLLPHLLASIGYIHNIAYRSPSAINGVAWSLEVEVQFYVLVPLLTTLFSITVNRTRRRALLLFFMAGSALASVPLAGTLAFTSILYYIPFFLAGFVVSDAFVMANGAWEENKSIAWDLVSIGAWPLVWILGITAGHLLLPFVFVLLFMAAFRGRVSSRILSFRWITNIGGMCYTIYLFHWIIISSCGRVTKPLHFGHSFQGYYLLQAVLVLPWVFAVCALYFVLIERPCMDRRWPSKLIKFMRSTLEKRRRSMEPISNDGVL